MPTTNTIKTMGFEVYNDDLSNVTLQSGRTIVLNTISPNSYGISQKDSVFRKALQKSDILVLDGVYFSLAALLLEGRRIRPNQGPTVFQHFMVRLNETHGKVFFFGSSKTTLIKMTERARKEFPNVKTDYHSPPFRDNFTEEDDKESLARINDFAPDVVFVSLTCPKQEKWAVSNKDAVKAKLICSVGAVFDWYSGNQKEISEFWWRYKIAWLKRTIDRPEIMLRYPNIAIFFRDLILIASKSLLKKVYEKN